MTSYAKKIIFCSDFEHTKEKKKTENVWSYAKCTHRNPNGKIKKSHKSISNGTTFTGEFFPFVFFSELQRR